MPRTGEDELDALRRRLYRPDASDEDRERYAALRDRLAPPRVPQGAEQDLPAPTRRRGIRAGALAGGLLIVGVVAAVLSLPPAGAPVPTATTDAAASSRPRPNPSRPTPVAVSVQGVATTAQRFHGVGPAVVPLVTGSAPPFGGRLVVVLTSEEDAPLGWAAARWASIGGGPSTTQVVASSPRRVRGPLGRPDTAVYGGDPPEDIEVTDPGSHPWTLTVAILDPDA